MTFLDRSPVVLGLITAVVIALGTLAALAVQGGFLRTGFTVTAEFADASGLRPGDQVLIAGVRGGEVRAVELVDGHVEAELFIDDTELTADTRARIIIRTLVGKRAVELQPSGDWSALLVDNDRIPMERTSLPVDVPEFADVSEELLRETDAEVLDEFLRALTEITRDQRAQVESLIEGGTRLTGIVNDQEQEVRELLRRLRTVAETFAARDAEIVQIIDEFGTVAAVLADHRDDVRALIRETNAMSATGADLVERESAELHRILFELHEITGVLSRHELALAEALAYSGDSIQGFASIGFAGPVPVPWGNVFVTSLGPAGVDTIAGCGGLIDQQLDQVLGPDPRTCEEQENLTWPDDTQPDPDAPQGPEPEIPLLPGAQAAGAPAPAELDAVARRALRDGGGPSTIPPIVRMGGVR